MCVFLRAVQHHKGLILLLWSLAAASNSPLLGFYCFIATDYCFTSVKTMLPSFLQMEVGLTVLLLQIHTLRCDFP